MKMRSDAHRLAPKDSASARLWAGVEAGEGWIAAKLSDESGKSSCWCRCVNDGRV